MGYTIQTINDEIASKVAHLEQHNGPTLSKQWLINAIMADHTDIQGSDSDYALCCSRFTVEKCVEQYFRSVKKAEDEGSQQEVLPGFEKLQKRYIVERDGEQVIVYIYDMTDVEIDIKAKQHRLMGDGHYRHADELERFKRERELRQAI